MKKYTKEERREKLKSMFKEHKEEILVTAGAAGLACLGALALVKFNKGQPFSLPSYHDREIDIDDLKIGKILDKPWNEGNVTNMIVNDIKVKDAGNFGESLKDILTVTDDTSMSVVLSFDNIYEKK